MNINFTKLCVEFRIGVFIPNLTYFPQGSVRVTKGFSICLHQTEPSLWGLDNLILKNRKNNEKLLDPLELVFES